MNAVARTTTTVSASALRARLGAKRFNPLAAAPKAVASKKAFSVQANSDKVQDGPPLYAEGELDIYRESPLRYMGYSNEVGEAFVAFLPGWGVPASYGVAGTSARAPPPERSKSPREKERSLRGTPPRGGARRARRSSIPPRLTAPILPLLIRSALYVLADTIDKGKKAADGEAGACPCTLLGTTTNATRKHIRFSSEPQPWNRSTVQTRDGLVLRFFHGVT